MKDIKFKTLLKKNITWELLFSIAGLVIALSFAARFMTFNESRVGAIIPDPILGLFKPIDVTWFTFVIIYFGVVFGFITLFKSPKHLIIGVQSYTLMVFFRMMAMYLIPLDPIQSIIILRDPFVELFGTGDTLLKDLFFSGHTASMSVIFLSVPTKKAKIIMGIGTLAVAFCVIAQHVHYSIDVFAAPFFAYTAYRIVKNIHEFIEIKK